MMAWQGVKASNLAVAQELQPVPEIHSRHVDSFSLRWLRNGLIDVIVMAPDDEDPFLRFECYHTHRGGSELIRCESFRQPSFLGYKPTTCGKDHRK